MFPCIRWLPHHLLQPLLLESKNLSLAVKEVDYVLAPERPRNRRTEKKVLYGSYKPHLDFCETFDGRPPGGQESSPCLFSRLVSADDVEEAGQRQWRRAGMRVTDLQQYAGLSDSRKAR